MVTNEECIETIKSGYFRVDDDGSVWRLKLRTRTGNIKTINPVRADYLDNTGYRRIRYRKHGSIMAHRLVWISAHGAIPLGLEINHKNLDKCDNRLSNLEIVTPSQNTRHAFDTGAIRPKHGEDKPNSKLTARQVMELRERVAAGHSMYSESIRLGVSRVRIRQIIRGLAWAHI